MEANKRCSDDPKPGPSNSSVNAKQSNDDTVNNRLKEFIQIFCNKFEAKLDEPAARAPPKAGVKAELPIIPILCMLPISEFPKEKTVKGDSIFRHIPKESLRAILEEAAFDIFRCFESQCEVVTCDNEKWERAIEMLALDAMKRSINFACEKENSKFDVTSDFITRGVIFGPSKDIAAGGFTVLNKNKINEKWKTTDLYKEVGIVTLNENGDCEKYYRKMGGDNAEKYGYRLRFEWETSQSVSTLYKECSKPSEEYKYTLKSEDLKQMLQFESRERSIQIARFYEKHLEPIASFISRDFELKKLHDTFQLEKSKIAFISGLGGVGKTQLAKKYAFDNCSSYYDENVVWINSEDDYSLLASFHKLSTLLGIENEQISEIMVTKIHNYFADKNSIFIFDNAGEYKDIESFLPMSGGIHILITTKSDTFFDEQWHGDVPVHIKLESWIEEQAVEFVKKILKLDDTRQDTDIQNLVNLLERLPLALQLAVSYINQLNLKNKIGEYVQKLQSEKDVLSLIEENAPKDYMNTILTTLKVTIRMIRTKIYGDLAEEILNIMAYFSPVDIPEETFLEIVQNRKKITKPMLTLAIKILKNYSIVSGDEMLSIHRLVQHVIRDELKNKNYTLIRTRGLLKKALETDTSVHYIPHAMSAWSYASKNKELVIEFTGLPDHIMGNLAIAGRFKEALLFGSGTCESLKRVLGSKHPDTLRMMNGLGRIHQTVGQMEDAMKIYQECLHKRIKVFGSDHPDTLLTMSNIATIYIHQGQFEEALTTMNKVYDVQLKTVDHNDPAILNTLNLIALALENQGKLSSALEVYTVLLKRQEILMGPYHPYTLNTMSGIATVLHWLGKNAEALTMVDKLIEKQFKTLETDDPLILNSMDLRALVLATQGKFSNALEAYKDVLERKEKVLGQNHPETLSTKCFLANLLNKHGKHEEALTICDKVYEIQLKTLHSDHPDIVTTMGLRASILSVALKTYKDELERQRAEKVLGPYHPLIFRTMSSIASVLSSQGNHEEALKIHIEMLRKSTRFLGADDPSTLEHRVNVTRVLDRIREL